MVRYWLCITNDENWKVIKTKHIWGVSERRKNKLESVEIGDYMIFYVKPARIGGIFKVASKPYVDKRKIFTYSGFSGKEVFPYRVKLEPVTVPEEPVDFKPLVPKLSFLTNKKRWSAPLRTAMKEIPREDFELIRWAIFR